MGGKSKNAKSKNVKSRGERDRAALDEARRKPAPDPSDQDDRERREFHDREKARERT